MGQMLRRAEWRLAGAPLVSAMLTPAYRTAARDARFRALARRTTYRGLRVGALLSALVAVVHFALLSALFPADTLRFLVLHGAELAVAVAALLVPYRIARHVPEAIAAIVAAMLLATAIATAWIEPQLSLMAAGYVALLPSLVVLLVSWRTRVHVAWCAAYLVAVLGLVPLVWPIPSAGAQATYALAVCVGVIASTAGSVLVQHGRIEAFLLRQWLQAVRLRAEAQRLELGHLSERLGQAARTDALTGIGNRLRLNEDLATLHGRLVRYGQQIGLVAIDVDHFKAINDRLGHLAGDDVLRKVADALVATLRTGDAVYRYGGDEFLVVVAGQTLRGSVAAAERLRRAVERLGLPNPGSETSTVVTVSAGVMTAGPSESWRDPAAWLARADAALYEAKRGGRNLVVGAGAINKSTAPSSPASSHAAIDGAVPA